MWAISKPPSKCYFGFKIVMIFARQLPDSLLTASWQLPDSRFLFLGIFVLFGLLTRENVFGQKCSFTLTACWQPDSMLTARGCSTSVRVLVFSFLEILFKNGRNIFEHLKESWSILVFCDSFSYDTNTFVDGVCCSLKIRKDLEISMRFAFCLVVMLWHLLVRFVVFV